MNVVTPVAKFSPSSLFSFGEAGVWFDPSDIKTLFQDTLGVTPVTAAGQSIGKILDKSGRGNHATQNTLTQRPLYQIDSNGKPYLYFDGIDDGMVTPTIAPSVDSLQVFSGVRKLSDASAAIIAETSTSGTANNGSFGLFAPSGATPTYMFRSRGTAHGDNLASGFSSPDTAVISAIGKISTSTSILRRNGVQVNYISSTQGTGNYLSYPLYIGRRAGSSIPFNGRIYSLIVRFGANLPDDQIAATETWVNGKTGAY
jgi:hypothetical protein